MIQPGAGVVLIEIDCCASISGLYVWCCRKRFGTRFEIRLATIYVIVIVRLVCDTAQTRTRPEGECCVLAISHTKRTMTLYFLLLWLCK